jgi:hypothetical protein
MRYWARALRDVGADRSTHAWSVASCVDDGGRSELLGCALQRINDVKR